MRYARERFGFVLLYFPLRSLVVLNCMPFMVHYEIHPSQPVAKRKEGKLFKATEMGVFGNMAVSWTAASEDGMRLNIFIFDAACLLCT